MTARQRTPNSPCSRFEGWEGVTNLLPVFLVYVCRLHDAGGCPRLPPSSGSTEPRR
jgi:hypothetical protein